MKKLKYLVLFLVLVIVWACTPKHRTGISIEDNPTHHYLMGMKLIEKKDITEAKEHFDRALYLDRTFSPALVGEALFFAIKAQKQKDKGFWNVDFKKALNFLDEARKYAKSDNEKFIYHVTAIRVYLNAQPKRWLSEAEKHYMHAINLTEVKDSDLPYYQTKSAAYFFMGYAYYKAYKFKKAEDVFSKVLSSKPGKWHDRADTAFKRAQEIIRAMGEYTLTKVGKKVAIEPEVTREDVAALLVDELHLDKFMSNRISVKSKLTEAPFVPADILNNPFKEEILSIIKWNIRGLQPEYDKTAKAYLFKPLEPVTRKQLALILEDLLIKLTGDSSIATAYFGTQHSPFPDVPVNVAWFNAVMTCTTRGLMEPDISGNFRPNEKVSGAKLILTLMKLRNLMNIY